MAGWSLEAALRENGGTSFGIESGPNRSTRFDRPVLDVSAVNEWRETLGTGGEHSWGTIFHRSDGETVGTDNGVLPLRQLIDVFP